MYIVGGQGEVLFGEQAPPPPQKLFGGDAGFPAFHAVCGAAVEQLEQQFTVPAVRGVGDLHHQPAVRGGRAGGQQHHHRAGGALQCLDRPGVQGGASPVLYQHRQRAGHRRNGLQCGGGLAKVGQRLADQHLALGSGLARRKLRQPPAHISAQGLWVGAAPDQRRQVQGVPVEHQGQQPGGGVPGVAQAVASHREAAGQPGL